MKQINFGETLKVIRKSKGISQQKLASDLDIPESNIRRYEANNETPNLERLKLIADYLQVSLDKLLGFSQLTPSERRKN